MLHAKLPLRGTETTAVQFLTKEMVRNHHLPLHLIVQSFMHKFGSKPANPQKHMPLLTDLPNGMNERISVGDNFFSKGAAQEGHAHN